MYYVKKNLLEIKELLKKFKENKISSIATLSSSLILPISLIWGIISIILFYVRNGFHFKFSSSIFSIYYNDVIKYLLIFFGVLSLIMILILYFKKSSKKSKIIFFTSIIGFLISISLMILFSVKENKNLTLIFAFIFLAFCFIPFIVIYKADISQVKTLVINNLIYYIILPLLLLIVSNVLPLVLAILVFSIINGISFASSGDTGVNSSTLKTDVKKQKKEQITAPSSNKKIIEVPNGMKLYREKGFGVPDYIVQDNGLASHKICTQEEFDKEKVIIVQNKNEIRYVGYRKK
ncbi:MAG: hypothetical protein HFH09_01210 [Bacilli bacterium]|nr:hypothetical protein [Bacilli bacterium]